MKALTWQGPRQVEVRDVPDPRLEEPTDAVVRITSTAICGSDLHLYEVLTPFMTPGDVLGHEPMGVVEEVGSAVDHIRPGDRVVVPFNISCGHCWMCSRGWYAQCETTQVRDQGTGAPLFGYSELYGSVPGGQAELMRVPQAQFGPIKVPEGPPDVQFLYLSDVLPTAWQAVEYADVPPEGSVAVFGLGPIGQLCCRIAAHRGFRPIGVDLVPERLDMARRRGIETIDASEVDSPADRIRELTDGRGTDSVIDAVGMEAHGSPVGELAQKIASALPSGIGGPMMEKAGVDRLAVLHQCMDAVRRAGTISLSGVYGGMADPVPMLTLFDKGVAVKMGQAHVKRWIDDLMPLVGDETDPLGVHDLATHDLPLEDAPHAYELFQKKQDDAIKIVLEP
ncbi:MULTISPECIES: zinc-dependent alcohol dehydrogenase [unclassified Saccharopolyspora]|uniref:zinc-dependent alcohol dehydrogenase n=1 Tax=unclassified Saccharopolyspora TaxID=2646250 RepID=UPI001CD28EDD|nr:MULTISPECIES: zinc-dependent alcohol dehydrogenase [unclassified Saccharopolyspora]MCA1184934.1 glutathione-dependent formaldehyde dehydrogenase [Saccharopolyspora sp. 6T]MCA1225437.1 glutathione-dependent formaldehyde dehydrogenase [Saccharopolyspora sp. 6M]